MLYNSQIKLHNSILSTIISYYDQHYNHATIIMIKRINVHLQQLKYYNYLTL